MICIHCCVCLVVFVIVFIIVLFYRIELNVCLHGTNVAFTAQAYGSEIGLKNRNDQLFKVLKIIKLNRKNWLVNSIMRLSVMS